MSNTRRRVKNKNAHKKPKATTPKDQHVAALHWRIDELEARTPIGQRRIAASFRSYQRLTNLLAWLIDKTDPTAAIGVDTQRVIVTQSPTDDDGIERAAQSVRSFVAVKEWIDGELYSITRQLEDKLDAGDFDRWKPESPRCWVRSCSMRAKRQPWDRAACAGCGNEFGK